MIPYEELCQALERYQARKTRESEMAQLDADDAAAPPELTAASVEDEPGSESRVADSLADAAPDGAQEEDGGGSNVER